MTISGVANTNHIPKLTPGLSGNNLYQNTKNNEVICIQY